MYLSDLFRQIFKSLWSHKTRTALALFGITWGTLSVLLLLSVANGFYANSVKELAFLNNGTIFAWPATTSKTYGGIGEGSKVHLNQKDFDEIIQNIPHIKNASPFYGKQASIQFLDKSLEGTIIGVNIGFEEMLQLPVEVGGRFFNSLDISHNKHVVFLDAELKNTLFSKTSAVGKTIIVNNLPFTVIGYQEKEGNLRIGPSNSVYIPYTTFLSLFGSIDISTIFVVPETLAYAPQIKHDLKLLLASKLHYDPTDEEAFRMPNLEDKQKFVEWFFRIIEFFLGFCGALTLSVGGLGVANMMFLIVTERTREIGLRKALGAKEKDILKQFLWETLTIISLGGFLGGCLTILTLYSLTLFNLPKWLGQPYVTLGSASLTTIILLCIGFLAGYFPARRAARLEPVKALTF